MKMKKQKKDGRKKMQEEGKWKEEIERMRKAKGRVEKKNENAKKKRKYRKLNGR